MIRKEYTAADCAREFLRNFGWSQGVIDPSFTNPGIQLTKGAGGDMLQVALDFLRRIEPFYPPRQAWALHVSIVRLVLYNLLNPLHPHALPTDVCVALVKEHGQYIGANESTAFHMILKGYSGKDALNIPAKVIKDLKAATFENLEGTLAKFDFR
jgi:hypothetical protein